MGGGKGGSVTSVEIPKELKPIYQQLGNQWSQAMQEHPYTGGESWAQDPSNPWGLDPVWGSALDWTAPGSTPYTNPYQQPGFTSRPVTRAVPVGAQPRQIASPIGKIGGSPITGASPPNTLKRATPTGGGTRRKLKLPS